MPEPVLLDAEPDRPKGICRPMDRRLPKRAAAEEQCSRQVAAGSHRTSCRSSTARRLVPSCKPVQHLPVQPEAFRDRAVPSPPKPVISKSVPLHPPTFTIRQHAMPNTNPAIGHFERSRPIASIDLDDGDSITAHHAFVSSMNSANKRMNELETSSYTE